MKKLSFNAEAVRITHDYILLRDIGPWDKFKTITNAAEEVVKELYSNLNGQKIYYIDSEGDLAELKYDENGNFLGFGSNVKL